MKLRRERAARKIREEFPLPACGFQGKICSNDVHCRPHSTPDFPCAGLFRRPFPRRRTAGSGGVPAGRIRRLRSRGNGSSGDGRERRRVRGAGRFRGKRVARRASRSRRGSRARRGVGQIAFQRGARPAAADALRRAARRGRLRGARGAAAGNFRGFAAETSAGSFRRNRARPRGSGGGAARGAFRRGVPAGRARVVFPRAGAGGVGSRENGRGGRKFFFGGKSRIARIGPGTHRFREALRGNFFARERVGGRTRAAEGAARRRARHAAFRGSGETPRRRAREKRRAR